MYITVNGEQLKLDGPLTVRNLLERLELEPVKIAIERNRAIVPKSAFDTEQLQDGDTLEIIQFVGGG